MELSMEDRIDELVLNDENNNIDSDDLEWWQMVC